MAAGVSTSGQEQSLLALESWRQTVDYTLAYAALPMVVLWLVGLAVPVWALVELWRRRGLRNALVRAARSPLMPSLVWAVLVPRRADQHRQQGHRLPHPVGAGPRRPCRLGDLAAAPPGSADPRGGGARGRSPQHRGHSRPTTRLGAAASDLRALGAERPCLPRPWRRSRTTSCTRPVHSAERPADRPGGARVAPVHGPAHDRPGHARAGPGLRGASASGTGWSTPTASSSSSCWTADPLLPLAMVDPIDGAERRAGHGRLPDHRRRRHCLPPADRPRCAFEIEPIVDPDLMALAARAGRLRPPHDGRAAGRPHGRGVAPAGHVSGHGRVPRRRVNSGRARVRPPHGRGRRRRGGRGQQGVAPGAAARRRLARPRVHRRQGRVPQLDGGGRRAGQDRQLRDAHGRTRRGRGVHRAAGLPDGGRAPARHEPGRDPSRPRPVGATSRGGAARRDGGRRRARAARSRGRRVGDDRGGRRGAQGRAGLRPGRGQPRAPGRLGVRVRPDPRGGPHAARADAPTRWATAS